LKLKRGKNEAMPIHPILEPRRTAPVDLWAGALLIIVGEWAFATMAAAIRAVSMEVSNEILVFFRNAFGLLFLLPWVARHGLRHSLSTRSPGLHLLRGLAGLGAMYCLFYSITHMPLAEAMLLKLSAPLFIPFVAYFWLREDAPVRTRWAIALGFAGVALILSPDFTSLAPVAAIGLLGGLLAAVAKVTVRRLSATEPTARIVLYFTLIGTAVSAIPLLWAWRTPSGTALPWLLAIGGLATLGQWCLTRGLSRAAAPLLAPFVYSSVVFAASYGWLFWGERITWTTVVGTLIVASAGLLAARPLPTALAPGPA
jgi:drug/metabolite transporter (DMT)-like permease